VNPLIVVPAAAAALALASTIPGLLMRRAQDRLARRLIDREGRDAFRLLTRAERVVGKFRRVPGILGLTRDALTFEDLFGDATVLATARIHKIVTGRRLRNGRTLIRCEVLRVASAAGEDLEFVLSDAAASAWRSHFGAWAGAERKAASDTVVPGRS
jgi:hypothetical protein